MKIPLVPEDTRQLWAGLIADVLTAGTVPCTGSSWALWTSSSTADRLNAAHLCTGCPVLEACAQYADRAGEAWHVYGGRDRQSAPELSDRPPRRRHRRKVSA